MQSAQITIGLPVQSLPEAIGWYRSVLGSKRTSQPLPHILEFEVSRGVCLQLVDDPELSPGDGVLRFRVSNVDSERSRLRRAGVSVSGITRHDGVIAFFHVKDPWGNRLCLFEDLKG